MAFDATDEAMMERALELAAEAARHDDVPIGAVVARGGEILGFTEPSATPPLRNSARNARPWLRPARSNSTPRRARKSKNASRSCR
jgi:hypothetical protein